MLAYIKAFHIIAIIAWMAGLLYLPRLFVYHAQSKPGSEQSETFKVMEKRLLRYITTPAMLVAWALGVALAFSGASRSAVSNRRRPSAPSSRTPASSLSAISERPAARMRESIAGTLFYNWVIG